MSITWITLTNGRKDLISQSRNSWYEKIDGKVDREIIIDDSGSLEYQDWLSKEYPSAEVIPVGDIPMGFSKAMIKCFEIAISSGSEYVLHTEDDFILNDTLYLNNMIKILKSNPKLSQIILQRQRWYEYEKNADTLIKHYMTQTKLNKVIFEDMSYMEHQYWYSANPSVYPISTAKLGWVDSDNSERLFSDKVFSIGLTSAHYGDEHKDEYVTHIGSYRLGYGH